MVALWYDLILPRGTIHDLTPREVSHMVGSSPH
jgi:hypothetical protein